MFDEQTVGRARTVEHRKQASAQMSHDWIGQALAGLDIEIEASRALLIGDLDQCAARDVYAENVNRVVEAKQNLAAQIINAGLALGAALVSPLSVQPDLGLLVLQPQAERERVLGIGSYRIGPLGAYPSVG